MDTLKEVVVVDKIFGKKVLKLKGNKALLKNVENYSKITRYEDSIL